MHVNLQQDSILQMDRLANISISALYVVQVDEDKLSKDICEDGVHGSSESCWRICGPESEHTPSPLPARLP
jgi:hypothetical protein